MSLNLPEQYVGLTDTDPASLIEHAEQVQRNFETVARGVQTGTEAMHVVGLGTEPSFENAWANFDAARQASFYRQGERVYLRGLVKSGTIGAAIFTLPAGYRPPTGVHIPVVSNGAFGYVEVASTGAVIASSGSNVWMDLSSVQFRVG